MKTVLSEVKTGLCPKIVKLNCQTQFCKRLQEMGVLEGALLKVLKNDFGPLILCVFGSRIAIGRNACKKIEVEI